MGSCCSQDAYLYKETLSDFHVNKPKRNLFKTNEEKISTILKFRNMNESIYKNNSNNNIDIPVF